MSAHDVVQECFEFDPIDLACLIKDCADRETSQRLFERLQLTSCVMEVSWCHGS